MTSSNGDGLVLSTVNAPYRRRIEAEALAHCVRSNNLGTWKVHVATFFTDVRAELVVRFAQRHAIDLETLAQTYRSVRDGTGERSPRLEAELVRLEVAASQDLRGLTKAG